MKVKVTVFALLTALLLVFSFGVQAQDATEEASGGTIVDVAVENGNFAYLLLAVKAAGLQDVLADPEAQWTVFAPTDDAFRALPAGVLSKLAADPALLTRVLTYHVVQGAVTSDQVSTMMAPSMEMDAVGSELVGSELDIVKAEDGAITVDGATVVLADVPASNGVIHVIDQVLLPADVAEMLGGDTMTATDEMMPTEEAMTEPGTIVDVALANGNFGVLVLAVRAAGLVDVLADPEAQWTVFAPTDEAFAAVPSAVLTAAVADDAILTRVLTYHVVQGVVTSDMISPMMAPSMEMDAVGSELVGSELDIQVGDDGTVTVNGANVVIADVLASNGVIHVVDSVLLPPEIAEAVAPLLEAAATEEAP